MPFWTAALAVARTGEYTRDVVTDGLVGTYGEYGVSEPLAGTTGAAGVSGLLGT